MTDMWMPGAEQRPQPGGVTMNPALPSRVTWHITWDALTNGQQPDFDGVAGYLERMQYCPHLMWDPWTGRIVQFYPADQGGRALVNWNQDGQYNIQIETFFSPGTVRDGVTYATVADTPCNGLDEILAWTGSLGIPRAWPMGPPQWTGNSRDPGIWNTQSGHYGHCNVPDNTHTDPGPMPDLNRGIAAMGSTISQEDDMANVPQAEWDWAKAVLTSLANNAATKTDLAGIPQQVLTAAVPYKDPVTAKDAGVTSLATLVGFSDFQHQATRTGVPAAVLNQQFKLADGTVTNLAGILTAIHAQPAAAGSPASTDPQAVVRALANQLNK